MTFIKYISLLIVYFLLAACGGASISERIQTGVFLDSPVKGLAYKTKTQSGMTNTQGEFFYMPGETVSFYLGDVSIGSAPAALLMTPLHLDSTDSLNSVRNFVRLLQTFDVDRSPENGIDISFKDENIPVGDINFEQTIEEFATDVSVIKLLENHLLKPQLVNEGKSFLHFQQSLIKNEIPLVEDLYFISGSITGLNGTLKLANQGIDSVIVISENRFIFPISVVNESRYLVTVIENPSGEVCRVINGEGEVNEIDVTSVAIICEIDSDKITGNVAGIEGTLIIKADDANIIISNEGFFTTGLEIEPELVEILKNPKSQKCIVDSIANSIEISCTSAIYSLAGSMQDMVYSLSMLDKVSGQSIVLSSDFNFPLLYQTGDKYDLEIVKQPEGNICQIINRSGVFTDKNIADVSIACQSIYHDVTVYISGITDTNTIKINDIEISPQSVGVYSRSIVQGSDFSVLVESNIETKSCALESSIQGNSDSGVNLIESKSVYFSCLDKDHWLGFSVDGFISDINVSIKSIAGDSITATLTNAALSIKASPRTSYQVSIVGDVAGQTCLLDQPTYLSTNLLTPIKITCVPKKYRINVDVNNMIGNGKIKNTVTGDTFTIPFLGESLLSFPYDADYQFLFVGGSAIGQTCNLENNIGKNTAGDENIVVNCSANDTDFTVNIMGITEAVSLNITEFNELNALPEKTTKRIYTGLNNKFKTKFYTKYSIDVIDSTLNQGLGYSCQVTSGKLDGEVLPLVSNSVDITCNPDYYDFTISVNNLRAGSLIFTDSSSMSFPDFSIDASSDTSSGTSNGVTNTVTLTKVVPIKRDGSYVFDFTSANLDNQSCTLTQGSLAFNNVSTAKSLVIDCVDFYQISLTVSGVMPVDTAMFGVSTLSLSMGQGGITVLNITDGMMMLTSTIYSADITNLLPTTLFLSDPAYQTCVFDQYNNEQSISLTSIIADIDISVVCVPNKYDLNFNFGSAVSFPSISILINGQSISNNAGINHQQLLALNDVIDLTIDSSPSGQICVFDDNTKKFNATFTASQSLTVNVSCKLSDLITETSIAQISDPAFRQCILDNVAGAEVSISSLTQLSCVGAYSVAGVNLQITSIDGIDMFPSLDALSFTDTMIKSFQPLRFLTKLDSVKGNLVITRNTSPALNDYLLNFGLSTGLKSCIEKIYTQTNDGTGRRIISTIAEINELICDGADVDAILITDLNGLEYLHYLSVLSLPNNTIFDVSPIAKLNVLQNNFPSHIIELVLTNNSIISVQNSTVKNGVLLVNNLSDLSSLKILDLSGNAITNPDLLISQNSNAVDYFNLINLSLLNLSGSGMSVPNKNFANIAVNSIDFYVDNLIGVAPLNESLSLSDTVDVGYNISEEYDDIVAEFNYTLDSLSSFGILSFHDTKVSFSIRFKPYGNKFSIDLISPNGNTYPVINGWDHSGSSSHNHKKSLVDFELLPADAIGNTLFLNTGLNQKKWTVKVTVSAGGNNQVLTKWQFTSASLSYGVK